MSPAPAPPPPPHHNQNDKLYQLSMFPHHSRWLLLVFGSDVIRTCAVHGMLWTAFWWSCLGLTSLSPWQPTRKVPFWVYYACFEHWGHSDLWGKFRSCQAVLCIALNKTLFKLINNSSSLSEGNHDRDSVWISDLDVWKYGQTRFFTFNILLEGTVSRQMCHVLISV